MMNNTPSSAKKVLQKYQSRKSPNDQMFSFLFFFRRATSKLHDFHGSFYAKQQHFKPSSAPTHCFYDTIIELGIYHHHTWLWETKEKSLHGIYCWCMQVINYTIR